MPGSKVEFKMVGDWRKMASALDSKRFEANLEANLGRATAFNGMMMAGEIRRRIKSRKYAKNSPLTILLKKSSTPLVDDGDLFGAVTSQSLDKYSVFIGILRSTMGDNGKPLVNLAELLHNGGVIPVTEHMRNMFILLSEVGQGKRDVSTLEGRVADMAKALGPRIKNIKALRASTTHIKIPARPFLTDVLKDPAMLKKCEMNWRKAVQATMRDQAQSTSKGGSSDAAAKVADQTRKGSKPAKSPANRSEAARRGWKTRRSRSAEKNKNKG